MIELQVLYLGCEEEVYSTGAYLVGQLRFFSIHNGGSWFRKQISISRILDDAEDF